MKKLLAILLMLSLLLAFTGCRKSEEKEPDANTTDPTVVETLPQTSISDDEFKTVSIINGVALEIGDTASFARLWKDTEYRSSKPSVVTVDQDGNVTAVGPGTALVLAKSETEERSSAAVYCVLPEGTHTDPSAAAPQIHEINTSYMMTSDVAGATYTSGNTDIMQAEENGMLHFTGSGYVTLTAANASSPRLFSFIVYDRVVESEK